MIAASAIAGITALRVGPSADGSDRRLIDAVPNAEVRLLPLDELHDAPLNGSHCSLSSHSARVHRHKTFRSLVKLFAECIGGFSTLGRLPCLQFAIDWTLARPCVQRDAFEQINETLGALIARPAMQRGELTLIVAPMGAAWFELYRQEYAALVTGIGLDLHPFGGVHSVVAHRSLGPDHNHTARGI